MMLKLKDLTFNAGVSINDWPQYIKDFQEQKLNMKQGKNIY